MTETAIEVRQDLVPAIPPRLQEAGITIRDDQGYRTLGIPPALRETHNIIFPTVELTQQNPDFWPTIREIRLTVATDAYAGASHHKGNECSLNKGGLYKLAEAAKIDLTTERIRADELGPTERCGWRATAKQRHSDGTQTVFQSSATFDNEAERLQIESQGNKDTVEKRWVTKIQKASELTETIAIERAIRGMLKLPHKHTKEDLAKPWLVVCYAFIPTTPETRAQAALALRSLYGDHGAVGAGGLAAAPSPAAGELSAGAAEEPQTDDNDEPVIDLGDDDEVGEVVHEEEADVPDPELIALAEAAKEVHPPFGSYQTKTLGWILEKRPASDAWLRKAARTVWQGNDAEFGRHLLALLTVHAPELLLEEEPVAE